MKEAFIGNCSHSEAPLIDILHQEGFAVTSVGKDLSAYYTDRVERHLAIDYTDKVAFQELLSKRSFDLYIPACNELFLKTITDLGIAEQFGLGSNDLLKKIIGKGWLSEAFKNCSILNLARREIVCGKKLDKNFLMGFLSAFCKGFLIKPLVNAGGKGIVTITSVKDIEFFCSGVFNLNENYIIEEILDGVEYSFSTFIVSNQVVGFYWDVELSNSETKTIDASIWSLSTRPVWLEGVLEDVRQVVANEKIQNGIFHLQIIEDAFGIPHVIDVTRRLSGDLYGNEVHFVTGFDLNRFYLSCLSDRIKYEFNYELLQKHGSWKNFFRFVCLEKNVGVQSGVPSLELSEALGSVKKTIYSCVNSSNNNFISFAGKRVFICHCFPDGDSYDFRDLLLSNDLYKIKWV